MKTIGLILMGLILCADLTHGRIGDSKEQCKARYSDPTKPPGRFDNIYGKGGVDTDCMFDLEGKCVRVSYRILFFGGVLSQGLASGPQFTEEQVMKLLALNVGGSEWVRKSDDKYGDPWAGIYVTKDGSRQARVSTTGVSVELVAYYEKLKALATPEAVGEVIDSFGK